MAQNLPRGTPARVLVLLTLLIGLVVVSAWRDALRRDRDTWVRFPTALGDTGLLKQGHLPVTLTTGGKTVSLTTGGQTLHRRDDRMFRVTAGEGAGLPFTLFTSRENLVNDEDPKLYARTAPHLFQRLHARLGPGSPDVSPTESTFFKATPAPAGGRDDTPAQDGNPVPPSAFLPGVPARPGLPSGSPQPALADERDPDSEPALPARERMEDGLPVRKAIPVEDEEPFMEQPPLSDKKNAISPKKGGL